MTESRKGRLRRAISRFVSKTPVGEIPAAEPRWTRESRPVLPPLRVGREWDRVRRIAYL